MSLVIAIHHANFVAEVNVFGSAGESITTEKASAESADGLPTCKGYVSQQKRIAELLELYKELIRKDAADLLTMNDILYEFDSNLSNLIAK